jgi:hypothetical protein
MANPATAGIHPSMAALYEAAKDFNDHQPADVARRLNISQQRLKNWDSRGISKEGALAVQDVYGIDGLALMKGDLRRLPQNSRSIRLTSDESQSRRFDSEMLALTHRALREIYRDELHRPYCLEDDPARFLRVYEFQASLSRSLPTADLIKVIKAAWLEQIKGGLENGRIRDGADSVPTEGIHKGRVAGRVQRKKG